MRVNIRGRLNAMLSLAESFLELPSVLYALFTIPLLIVFTYFISGTMFRVDSQFWSNTHQWGMGFNAIGVVGSIIVAIALIIFIFVVGALALYTPALRFFGEQRTGQILAGLGIMIGIVATAICFYYMIDALWHNVNWFDLIDVIDQTGEIPPKKVLR